MCQESSCESIAACAVDNLDPLPTHIEEPEVESSLAPDHGSGGARTLYKSLTREFADQSASTCERPEPLPVKHRHLHRLIMKARQLEPLRVAIVAPDEEHALKGAILAAETGLIEPILFGDRDLIEEAARAAGCSIRGYELVEADTTREAAAKAVEAVVAGHAQTLMKGNLHTDELLHEVLKKNGGLRGPRRVSHVFVMDAPGLDQLLLISDAAINVAPTLEEKADITQNAIDLALSLGLKLPRVGILSAVETVTPKSPPRSTPPSSRKWPSAARSRAASWTGRSRWTTPSTSKQREPRASPRWWPGARTS